MAKTETVDCKNTDCRKCPCKKVCGILTWGARRK